MTILITGFEPFGCHKTNNSWEVVKTFKNRDRVKVLCLPVSFSRAHYDVIDQLEKQYFDVIIMLGETSVSEDYIRLERVAINFKDSVNGDNDGENPDEEILINGAPVAYFTKFPVKKVARQLKEAGYPVKVTNSAGTFVCNSLYFNILHYIEKNQLNTKALFVHVPASTQVMSLKEMKNTLEEIVNNSLSYKEKRPHECL